MTLQFRDANPTDLAWIVKVYNSTIPGRMVTADMEPVTVDSRLEWFHRHEPAHRPLWVVTAGNEKIGWASFQSFYGRPAYQGTAEISIYLDEKSRGKGFGKLILEHAIEACDRLEIKTLLGFIFAHNLQSMQLFRSMGFETWGHLPRVANLGDTERDLIIVGKRIGT